MFQIPRYLGVNTAGHQPVVISLICFSDALGKDYATAVYFHQISSNNCSVDLVFSKTRLASQRIMIPRLELLGLLIGARTMKGAVLTYFIQNFVDRLPMCATVA